MNVIQETSAPFKHLFEYLSEDKIFYLEQSLTFENPQIASIEAVLLSRYAKDHLKDEHLCKLILAIRTGIECSFNFQSYF